MRGTKDFVTALQLDTKPDDIPSQVLAGALQQAKEARPTILKVMAEAIDEPDEMSPYAPASPPSRFRWTRSARSSGRRAR